jgi:hypothetical protein
VSAAEQPLAGNRHPAGTPIPAGGAGENNPVAAFVRVARSPARHPGRWEGIDWDELPKIRQLVDQFPRSLAVPRVTPRWDADAWQLGYGSRLARERKRGAPMVQKVLDAFDDAGWPDRIPSPFGEDAERLHNTLNRLRGNGKLKHITFESSDGGDLVWWRAASKGVRPAEGKRHPTAG